MNLRLQAEADLGSIMEDTVGGFGWPITVTDPDGTVRPLVGLSTDIAQVIDPDTGQVVSGRLVSVSIRIATLTAAGLALPRGESDRLKKPWLVTFDDINGNPYTFKVQSADPDRAIGLVVCILEVYKV
jgi:hypothetical protein